MTFERIDSTTDHEDVLGSMSDCIALAGQRTTDGAKAEAVASYLYSLPLNLGRVQLMSAVFNAPKGTFGALVASRIAAL